MGNQKKFIFSGYDFNLQNGRADFRYEIIGEERILFTETIIFPKVDVQIPDLLLRSMLESLSLVLGISYWKLYCPNIIEIKNFSLTKEQANFWNILYTKGLGEFFYKNKIDFRGFVQFPFENKLSVSPIQFPRKERYLVGVGGGKDSIVTVEQFKKEGKDFDVFLIGESQIQKDVVNIMKKSPIVVKRSLDPKLFELNKTGKVFNGHVPISSIIAFLSVMVANFYDYKYIVVSNEKSANYGNVSYLGEEINHQWSKSEDFETLFQIYLEKFINPNIKYYSPLRGMDEFDIAKEFSKYTDYFDVFSSCNKNFKINSNNLSSKWCGECPKCLFTFILLSAFIPKKEILSFFGKNLFEDEVLLPTLRELVGQIGVKPFECVGTPDEVKKALELTYQKNDFNSSMLMKEYVNAIR